MRFKIIIALFAVLLLAILYFDFLMYRNFVLDIGSRIEENSEEAMFLLKTPLLEKAAEEIRKKDELLENPTYPLIKDPF